MKKTKISQGPWTRIRPLQRDELDLYTEAGMTDGEITWGHFPNNLCKVMAHLPKMVQHEIEYCNTFIFDPPTFRGDVQEAGFNDRCLRELVISRVALANRCRYSVTHHAFLGKATFEAEGRLDEVHDKYIHLHEHDKHPETYTERERVVLDYTVNVNKDAHLVTDAQYADLRRVLRENNMLDARLKAFSDDQMERHLDSQVVELTWLMCHYSGLNRFLTALQTPDEGPDDEQDFTAFAATQVPDDVRKRNEDLLAGDF